MTLIIFLAFIDNVNIGNHRVILSPIFPKFGSVVFHS